jgi:Family of unknown function (DUF6049)
MRHSSALVVVLCLLTCSAPARAQDPPIEARLALTSQAVSYELEDSLDLQVTVSNEGGRDLEGFELTVAAYDRVDSRSELHDIFNSAPRFPPDLFTKTFEAERIPSGGSTSVSIEDPVSTLSPLAAATEGGVYPLTVELFDPDDRSERLDVLTTPLILYPSAPETPLNLSLVVPLTDYPARSPNGSFGPDTSGRWPLEEALGRGGWLRGVLNTARRWSGTVDRRETGERGRRGRRRMERGPGERGDREDAPDTVGGVHLGLAPMPRLAEEVGDMSNGYARSGGEDRPEGSAPALSAAEALEDLDALLSRTSVQPLLLPYSYADLPTIQGARVGDAPAADSELAVGENVLDNLLAVDFERRWVLPPDGRLDVPTLEALQTSNTADSTFFSEDSLEAPSEAAVSSCTEAFATFTCPIRVETPAGESDGYVMDEGLQARLDDMAHGGGDRLDLHRFLAESATIWAELPGREGRVVHATMPALWHPGPRTAGAFFKALATAPWLNTVTPAEGLANSPTAVREVVPSLPGASRAPDLVDITIADSAGRLIDSFVSSHPPDGLVEGLRRDVLMSQSRLWWGSEELAEEGGSYAAEASARAFREMQKVRIGAPGSVTLTSRRGEIKLEVFNDAAYPMRVAIDVQSTGLGIERRLIRTIPAGKQRPVTVQVDARFSGTFPLFVSTKTPDGLPIQEGIEIAVTSTQFNRIALGLTIGALIFLVLFYLNRGIKRRRTIKRQQGAGATAT